MFRQPFDQAPEWSFYPRTGYWEPLESGSYHSTRTGLGREVIYKINRDGYVLSRPPDLEEPIKHHRGQGKHYPDDILPFKEIELAVRAYVDGNPEPLARYLLSLSDMQYKRTLKELGLGETV